MRVRSVHWAALISVIAAGSVSCKGTERTGEDTTADSVVTNLPTAPTQSRQPRRRVVCGAIFDADLMADELTAFSRNGEHDSHRPELGTLCASMSLIERGSKLVISPSFSCAADAVDELKQLAALAGRYQSAVGAEKAARSKTVSADGLGRGGYASKGSVSFLDDDTNCIVTLGISRDQDSVSIAQALAWARRLAPSIQKRLRSQAILDETASFSTLDAKIVDVDCTSLVVAAQSAEPTFEIRTIIGKKRSYGVECPRLGRNADSISIVAKCYDQAGRANRDVDTWRGHPNYVNVGGGARSSAQELHLYDLDSDCALELSVSVGGSILPGHKIAADHRALIDALLKAADPSIRK